MECAFCQERGSRTSAAPEPAFFACALHHRKTSVWHDQRSTEEEWIMCFIHVLDFFVVCLPRLFAPDTRAWTLRFPVSTFGTLSCVWGKKSCGKTFTREEERNEP